MNYKVEQAVILAGGRGERLKPFTDTAPKPMFVVQGKPFIEYLIMQAKSFGLKKVLVLLGYRSEMIEEYLKTGEKYGIDISYDVTPVEYETGERLCHAVHKLENEFLLMYCDNYCPFDFKKHLQNFYETKATIQLLAYANKDNYTKNNLKINDDNGMVELYDKRREKDGLSGVDIGYALIKKEALDYLPGVSGNQDWIDCEKKGNFEAQVYPQLVEQAKVYATVTEHRYYSIGSYERIALTEEFFRPKKVAFVDRDGTINVKPPRACYIENPDDFVWLPKSKEAIVRLKESNYLVILVTNQPGIARGNLTKETLKLIHKKMINDLKKVNSGIDAIYYCPHNWDEGCFCRKPNPGMFFMAQRDFSLNLSECIMFGDDERDIQAGEAAGVRSYLVSDEYSLYDAVNDLLNDKI